MLVLQKDYKDFCYIVKRKRTCYNTDIEMTKEEN